MRTLAVLLILAGAIRGEDLPTAWSDELPVAWTPERTPPARTRVEPSYRWTREHAGQLSLWDGARFVGAWRELDGDFVAWPGWTVVELPTPLPKSQLYRVKKTELSAWLSHPLNVGSCPCGATGGCRCSPHDNCKGGKCAEQNPYLSASAVKVGPPRTQPQYVPVLQATR